MCRHRAGARRGAPHPGARLSESHPAPIRAKQDERIVPRLSVTVPDTSALRTPLSRIADIVPWFAQNALVHYLSPRGLEQYSGGGWGTRDVCQGPVELLLALGRVPPLRDVLLRVMRQQNPDGDWPQWFMFFEPRAEHPSWRLARRHCVLAAGGARSISHRFRRWRSARRGVCRFSMRVARTLENRPLSGSTRSAPSR